MSYLISILMITLLFWQNAIADPIAKEVIRAMDEVIADHIEWDNWEEWNKLMQKVKLSTNSIMSVCVSVNLDGSKKFRNSF